MGRLARPLHAMRGLHVGDSNELQAKLEYVCTRLLSASSRPRIRCYQIETGAVGALTRHDGWEYRARVRSAQTRARDEAVDTGSSSAPPSSGLLPMSILAWSGPDVCRSRASGSRQTSDRMPSQIRAFAQPVRPVLDRQRLGIRMMGNA